jgi:hypothetical protein
MRRDSNRCQQTELTFLISEDQKLASRSHSNAQCKEQLLYVKVTARNVLKLRGPGRWVEPAQMSLRSCKIKVERWKETEIVSLQVALNGLSMAECQECFHRNVSLHTNDHVLMSKCGTVHTHTHTHARTPLLPKCVSKSYRTTLLMANPFNQSRRYKYNFIVIRNILSRTCVWR